MKKLRVAVIGVGHLGRHHARILAGLPDVVLVGVADASAARCAEVAGELGVSAFEDYRALVPRVDAASIVVPTSLHFEVASAFLAAGKSVLVEKPLTADAASAGQLVELARRRNTILQVGHIEEFNPVLGALPHRADPPRSIDVRRVGPFSFRSTDISVVFDLMIHDLDLLLRIVRQPPCRIEAEGWSVYGGQLDVVTARLGFPSGTVAHLLASRADVRPCREMTVRWSDCMAQLDFAARRSVVTAPTADFRAAAPLFRHPPAAMIPSLRERLHRDFFSVAEQDWNGGPELLALELTQFVHCVREHVEPRVGGDRARAAVELAETIQNAALAQPELTLSHAA